MPDINRRGFVGSVAASVPIAAASRHLLRSGKSAPLDDALMGALGHALLPTELGSDNTDRVVDEFQQWLELYSTDAELNHGYGTSEIDYTPGDPTSRWQDQLDGLNAEAQRRFGASFVDLDADVRRGFVLGGGYTTEERTIRLVLNEPSFPRARRMERVSSAGETCFNSAQLGTRRHGRARATHRGDCCGTGGEGRLRSRAAA